MTEFAAYNPAVHHRRSIRLRGHDYSARGVYFVTILAKDRRRLFGTVVNGRVALSEAGRIASRCWQDIPKHFPHVALDAWIVMPDHVHGILVIREDGHGGTIPGKIRPHGTARTIGSVVRGFKIGVTKSLGESPWHRNYHERVIRNTCALDTVRAYIRNNPAQWDVVRYGEPRFFAGNRKLLDLPLTAYLASRTRGRGGESAGKGDSRGGSRGESKGEGKGEKFFALTGGALTAAGDISDIQCVVSGFLSPMERDVLRMCLAEDIPAVQVLARGLPQRFPALVRRAVDVGRLLVMTPFGADVTRVSAERAVWCNQYAMYLAQLIVIGKLSSGGLLDCLLSDLPANKPIQILSKQQDCQ